MEADAEFDLVAEFAQHLLKELVAVSIEVGVEKLRYVTGTVAANHNGKLSILRSTTSIGKPHERSGR